MQQRFHEHAAGQEPADLAPVVGRRVAARARVAIPARLQTVGGTRQAVLRNISATGAMLEVTQLPRVGKDAALRCAGLDLFGEIVWARAPFCGLAFDQPISHDEVLRLRQASDRGTAVQKVELQRTARLWAQGIGFS